MSERECPFLFFLFFDTIITLLFHNISVTLTKANIKYAEIYKHHSHTDLLNKHAKQMETIISGT